MPSEKLKDLNKELENVKNNQTDAGKAHFWKSHRDKGDRDSALKGHAQNLTCFMTQGRNSNLEGSDLPADLGQPPREAETSAHHGDIDAGDCH